MAKVAKTNHLLFSIFGATAHPDRTSDSYVTLKKKRIKRKLAKMDPVLLIRGPWAPDRSVDGWSGPGDAQLVISPQKTLVPR